MRYLTFLLAMLVAGSAFPQAGLGGALLKGGGVNADNESILNLPPKVVENSYEAFLFYDKLCKKQNHKACLLGAKISRLDPPPKQIFDLSESRRIGLSLQLLERAIDGDELEAMELAYDIYYVINPIEKALTSHADDSRADELLKIMLNKNYSGGLVRQAYRYLVHPDFFLSFSKKKEGCQLISQLLSQSGLTDATKKILEDLNSGNTYLICKAYQ
jgi:hypothetical protein